MKNIKQWLADKLYKFVLKYTTKPVFDLNEKVPLTKTEYDIVPYQFEKIYLKRDIWSKGDTWFENCFKRTIKDEIMNEISPVIFDNLELYEEDIPSADAVRYKGRIYLLRRK